MRWRGEKVFENFIAFFNCYGKENFSFKGTKFLGGVRFCGVQFESSFESCKFHGVVFERKFDVWMKRENNSDLVCSFRGSEFVGESVFRDLTIKYPVDFSGSQIEDIEFNGVNFKEQVSFIESKIKELKIDKHGKSTIFSQLCSFKDSNIGDLHFYDGTEFRDLKFENIKESGENIKISFKNVKINGKLEFHNSQEVKVNSLTFESVEFGGGVSFISMQIENFEMKGNENPIKDSVLKSHCRFSNIQIEKADFSNTQFGGEVQFDRVKFNQSVSFKNAIFDKNISFPFSLFPNQSSSETQIDFSSATFKGFIELEKTDEEEAKLYNCSFLGASFEGGFKSSEVSLVSPKFCSCTFKKAFKFKDLKCEGDVDFSKAVFEDEVIFDGE